MRSALISHDYIESAENISANWKSSSWSFRERERWETKWNHCAGIQQDDPHAKHRCTRYSTRHKVKIHWYYQIVANSWVSFTSVSQVEKGQEERVKVTLLLTNYSAITIKNDKDTSCWLLREITRVANKVMRNRIQSCVLQKIQQCSTHFCWMSHIKRTEQSYSMIDSCFHIHSTLIHELIYKTGERDEKQQRGSGSVRCVGGTVHERSKEKARIERTIGWRYTRHTHAWAKRLQ
jgi:hypothetical protein